MDAIKLSKKVKKLITHYTYINVAYEHRNYNHCDIKPHDEVACRLYINGKDFYRESFRGISFQECYDKFKIAIKQLKKKKKYKPQEAPKDKK